MPSQSASSPAANGTVRPPAQSGPLLDQTTLADTGEADQQSGLPNGMDDLAFEQIALYFKALSEPARLKVLALLKSRGSMNVSELTEFMACSQPNVSKHLAVLTQAGLIRRQTRGTASYFEIADPRVHALCELACGSLCERLEDGLGRQGQLRNRLARGLSSTM